MLLSSPSIQLSYNRAKCKGASEAQAMRNLLVSLLKVCQHREKIHSSFPIHSTVQRVTTPFPDNPLLVTKGSWMIISETSPQAWSFHPTTTTSLSC
ncbi:uncharacterized protein ACIQIH_009980 isoform 2-T2 [Cyanocitta cristata]